MTAVLIALAVWVICGVCAAGIAFAYFQDEFPTIAVKSRRADLMDALRLGLMGGPFSLVVSFLFSGLAKHGWRLR